MRRTASTLALVVALAAGTPAPTHAQSATAKPIHKNHRVLFAVLGGVAGAGLGALWIYSFCPNGSDSPRLCIGPPVAFIAGGALAGYALGRKSSQTTPSPSTDRIALPAAERAGASSRSSDEWVFDPRLAVTPFPQWHRLNR